MLPEDHRVGVEFLAVFPQLVQQDRIAAVGAVAHDHVLRQPGHVVNGLLLVILGENPGGEHGEHIRQRQDSPAVFQPQQHFKVELGLHPPDNGPVAVLFDVHGLVAVGLFGDFGDFPVVFNKQLRFSADAQVVGLGVYRQIQAQELGIGGLVDVQPFQPMPGGLVDPLGAGEIVVPVPFCPGLLLDEGNGAADLLGGILLHILPGVPQGHGQLEAGDAVLQLQPLGDDAVAHERAVAGGVALDGALAQNAVVVVNGDAGLRGGHGAHIPRQAEFLDHIQIVLCRILPQQIGHIQRGDLPAQALQGGEAHHNGRHLVLVQQHHPVGKGSVVADAAVPPEELVQSLGNFPDDQAVFQVGDPQVGPPETLRHPVHHHGHRQIVDHPAVAQKAPEIPGLGNEPQEHPENTQPAEIVIHRIPQPPPFPPPPDLPGGVQAAQRFASNSFAHFRALPETSCDFFAFL